MSNEVLNNTLLVCSILLFTVTILQVVHSVRLSVINKVSHRMLYPITIVATICVAITSFYAFQSPKLNALTVHYTLLCASGLLLVCLLQIINGTVKSLTKAISESYSLNDNVTVNDSLTGLYNRHYLNNRIETEMARSKRHSAPLSVVVMNLSNFHSYNTVYGFQAGDSLLAKIADVITLTLRETDVVARYEADRFVMLLTDTPEHCTEIVINRLQKSVMHLLNSIDTNTGITLNVNFGEAWCELNTRSGAQLIDIALDQIQEEKCLLNKQDRATLQHKAAVEKEYFEAA